MKIIIKILAVYSLLISLYVIITNFLMLGEVAALTPKRALFTLLFLAPVTVFSILVILYFRKYRIHL